MFGPDLEKGFDVVIGNPPYVQIQKFDAAHKAAWVAQKFKTYEASGDVYCLFYERGVRLLKSGGHLCYITSNKWMRAGYGEELRKFLSADIDVLSVIDFGMAQNFGAATTYTCVVHGAKRPSQKQIRACYVTDDLAAMRDPGDYFERNALIREELNSLPWVLMSAERYSIKQTVSALGVPLDKWHIQINYGIKTGYNVAFYITTEQRDAFIFQDPKCGDFIVPLLRGRYVERFATGWHEAMDEKWMIATFPSLDLKLSDIPKPLRKHLEAYRQKLEPKPRDWKGANWAGRKAGSYQWYETQDPIAYREEFKKPKIIYPNMTKYLPFYYDGAEGFFGNQKCFIITTENESLHYLTAVLNSALFRCCFKDSFPELLGSTYELSKIFFDKIPIRKPTDQQVRLFYALIPLIQGARATVQRATDTRLQNAANFLEEVIDGCVMEVYFADHMAEKKLSLIEHVTTLLGGFSESASKGDQAKAALRFYELANDSKHPVRNILIRIPVDSPELLAVIQKEGAV